MGHIEGISAGVMFGWVCSPSGESTCIEVTIDGAVVGSFKPSFARHDIAPEPGLAPARGFAINLEAHLRPGTTPTIEAIETHDRHPLVGSPVAPETLQATGVVDAVVGPQIRGWVVIGDSAPELASLELWVDGQLEDTFKAQQLRTDLRHIGITRTRSGFDHPLPERFHDGQPHAIQIKVKGTACILREGEFSLTVPTEAAPKADDTETVHAETAPPPAAERSIDEQLAQLQGIEHRFMLHILHAWGGGTQSHALDICQRLHHEGIASLLLQPGAQGGFKLTNPGNGLSCHLPASTGIDALARHLSQLGVWHIHIHHTIGLPQTIWTLPQRLGIAFDVTVHDHYLACPRVNLLHATGVFCGQPPIDECERCIKAETAPLQELIANAVEASGGTVAHWRALHGRHLNQARRVFTPSHDAAKRTALNFPQAPIVVQPHPEPPGEPPSIAWDPSQATLRVALLGHIARNKGHKLLLEVARLTLAQQQPLRFVIVGDTCDDTAYADLPNVDILGAYQPAELPDLITLAHCQAALFLSNWPETYSYTLSEAWRANLLPVVTGLGAQAERVQTSSQGIVLSAEPPAQEVIEALMQLRQNGFRTPAHQTPIQGRGQATSLLHGYYQLQQPG